MRLRNQHTDSRGTPPPRPLWPAGAPGAALTIDPSMPPPTTAQEPFCDWPPGRQVPSYPEHMRGVVPRTPRLGNAAPVGRAPTGSLARCYAQCVKNYPPGSSRVTCYNDCKAWRSAPSGTAGSLQGRVIARQRQRIAAGPTIPAWCVGWECECPSFWEPCGTHAGKVRCCPSGSGTTDPSWVSPKQPHWPNPKIDRVPSATVMIPHFNPTVRPRLGVVDVGTFNPDRGFGRFASVVDRLAALGRGGRR